MGDRDTQTQQEPSWWAYDASPEDLASSPSFDQPVEWPDAMAWESLFAGGPETQPAYVPDDLAVDLLFAPEAEGGDVGGGPPIEAPLAPLPASIWAPDPADDAPEPIQATMAALGGAATAVARPAPAPMAVAEADAGRRAAPQWMRRFHVRHGNAAVVALACCVSLVLLGMFLSVRARDDLPTQTTQFEPTGGRLATEGPTSSVPQPTTTATTTAPPPSISLSDLIPADAAATGTGDTSGTTARTAAPATTAAPSRTAAPSGGSGGSSQQPTNTTAAPVPEPTTPSTTSPPPEDTTTTPTTARRVMPSVPDFDYTVPSFTIPSRQSPTPGSSFRTTDN